MRLELPKHEIPEHLRDYFEPIVNKPLDQKQLVPIPWMLAMALQADGWFLRSAIIWAKGISFCKTYSGSCMPGSQKDRVTVSHENVFLLSKSRHYWYDNEAVKEQAATGWNNSSFTDEWDIATKAGLGMGERHESARRTLRSVWAINPEPSSLPFYAAFPQRLIEPMIKAGTSEHGCCPRCGAGWKRVAERTGHTNKREPAHVPGNSSTKVDSTGWAPTSRTTGEWQPGCTCYDELINVYEMPDGKWAAAAQCVISEPFDTQELAKRRALEQMTTIPATVLDPFLGSGVTLKVAARLRRHGIGIELSEAYAAMAVEQLRKPLQVELF